MLDLLSNGGCELRWWLMLTHGCFVALLNALVTARTALRSTRFWNWAPVHTSCFGLREHGGNLLLVLLWEKLFGFGQQCRRRRFLVDTAFQVLFRQIWLDLPPLIFFFSLERCIVWIGHIDLLLALAPRCLFSTVVLLRLCLQVLQFIRTCCRGLWQFTPDRRSHQDGICENFVRGKALLLGFQRSPPVLHLLLDQMLFSTTDCIATQS